MSNDEAPQKKANKRANSAKSPAIRRNSKKLTNIQAAEMMVEHLQKTDRLDDLDVAHVTILLSLARACDAVPDSAPLWAQYRHALTELYERVNNGDDDFNDLMARLSAASSHPSN
jgi:hypothetical protein